MYKKCTIFWILFWKKVKKVQKSTKKVVKSKGDFLWRVVTTYSKLYFFYLWQVKKVPKSTISKWYIFLMLIVLVLVLILVLIQPPENLNTEVRHKGLAISMKVGLRCNKIFFCLGEEWDQYWYQVSWPHATMIRTLISLLTTSLLPPSSPFACTITQLCSPFVSSFVLLPQPRPHSLAHDS